jgi:ABC-type multidrug transport system fused ATPase/permease subunit
MSSGMRVEDVWLRRDGRPVLRGVSFRAPMGEVTALVGVSGSGKSSVLRCLNRLEQPDSGRVFLDDVDIATLDAKVLRRRVGLVLQAPVMLPGDVRANLAHGLAEPSEDRMGAALTAAGLDVSFLPRDAGGLSGGERARVALARALVRRPEVLVLDEPTAALDAGSATRVGDTLCGLAASGYAVIVTSHDLLFARRIADRLVEIRDGAVVSSAQGSRPTGGWP